MLYLVKYKRPLNTYFVDDLSLRVMGDKYVDHNPESNPPNGEDFKLYTMDLSYFSGKMEMYLRYKQIRFQRIEPTSKEFETILSPNTGTEQLPQLYDCRKSTIDSKRWLRDTTPMIQYLEEEYPKYSILPECELQQFFQLLFEDYADEYLWRHAMFMRWEPTFDRKVMGERFYYEFTMQAPFRLKFVPHFMRPYLMSLRQWLLSSYGEDCTTQRKKDVIVNYYYKLLSVLEEILSKQPYLFGNKPTLVDFAFSGPFFRHFFSDFTPRKIMQQKAPAVHEWVARLWNAQGEKFVDLESGFPVSGELPASWGELLPLLGDYLRYMQLNYNAYISEKDFFEFEDNGEVFVVPVVHYRAWCLQEIHNKFRSLDFNMKKKIRQILASHDLLKYFFPCVDEDLIYPECGTNPPFCIKHNEVLSCCRLSYKWNFNSILWKWAITDNPIFKIGLVGGLVVGGMCILNNNKK